MKRIVAVCILMMVAGKVLGLPAGQDYQKTHEEKLRYNTRTFWMQGKMWSRYMNEAVVKFKLIRPKYTLEIRERGTRPEEDVDDLMAKLRKVQIYTIPAGDPATTAARLTSADKEAVYYGTNGDDGAFFYYHPRAGFFEETVPRMYLKKYGNVYTYFQPDYSIIHPDGIPLKYRVWAGDRDDKNDLPYLGILDDDLMYDPRTEIPFSKILTQNSQGIFLYVYDADRFRASTADWKLHDRLAYGHRDENREDRDNSARLTYGKFYNDINHPVLRALRVRIWTRMFLAKLRINRSLVDAPEHLGKDYVNQDGLTPSTLNGKGDTDQGFVPSQWTAYHKNGVIERKVEALASEGGYVDAQVRYAQQWIINYADPYDYWRYVSNKHRMVKKVYTEWDKYFQTMPDKRTPEMLENIRRMSVALRLEEGIRDVAWIMMYINPDRERPRVTLKSEDRYVQDRSKRTYISVACFSGSASNTRGTVYRQTGYGMMSLKALHPFFEGPDKEGNRYVQYRQGVMLYEDKRFRREIEKKNHANERAEREAKVRSISIKYQEDRRKYKADLEDFGKRVRSGRRELGEMAPTPPKKPRALVRARNRANIELKRYRQEHQPTGSIYDATHRRSKKEKEPPRIHNVAHHMNTGHLTYAGSMSVDECRELWPNISISSLQKTARRGPFMVISSRTYRRYGHAYFEKLAGRKLKMFDVTGAVIENNARVFVRDDPEYIRQMMNLDFFYVKQNAAEVKGARTVRWTYDAGLARQMVAHARRVGETSTEFDPTNQHRLGRPDFAKLATDIYQFHRPTLDASTVGNLAAKLQAAYNDIHAALAKDKREQNGFSILRSGYVYAPKHTFNAFGARVIMQNQFGSLLYSGTTDMKLKQVTIDSVSSHFFVGNPNLMRAYHKHLPTMKLVAGTLTDHLYPTYYGVKRSWNSPRLKVLDTFPEVFADNTLLVHRPYLKTSTASSLLAGVSSLCDDRTQKEYFRARLEHETMPDAMTLSKFNLALRIYGTQKETHWKDSRYGDPDVWNGWSAPTPCAIGYDRYGLYDRFTYSLSVNHQLSEDVFNVESIMQRNYNRWQSPATKLGITQQVGPHMIINREKNEETGTALAAHFFPEQIRFYPKDLTFAYLQYYTEYYPKRRHPDHRFVLENVRTELAPVAYEPFVWSTVIAGKHTYSFDDRQHAIETLADLNRLLQTVPTMRYSFIVATCLPTPSMRQKNRIAEIWTRDNQRLFDEELEEVRQ